MELTAELAEIGVMLMMFGVGLYFSIRDLMAVQRIAIPGAIVQITAATALAAVTAQVWGWSLGPVWSSASRSRAQARSCSFGRSKRATR